MEFKMVNKELEVFVGFLMDEELVGRLSRLRSKFCKALDEKIVDFREDLKTLIDEYALKDENGELLYDESKTSIKIAEGKVDELNKEIEILQDEEVTIVLEESVVEGVKDILENTERKFKGNDALVYDKLCDMVGL